MEHAHDIGRMERASLRLVFGGPASWWVALARVVGVRVAADAEVDERLLAAAERGAVAAGRRFAWALAAALAFPAALIALLPAQSALLGGYRHEVFHAVAQSVEANGGSFGLADLSATVAILAIGLTVGMANALVFGGIPLLLLRRCTVAAAPAVSVALAQGDDATLGEQAERYPRVALAAEQILHPGTGWRRGR